MDTNQDMILALLQIRLPPVGAGLPSTATMLFNRPIHGLLPQNNRAPINVDNDGAQYEALEAHQNKYKTNDTQKSFSLFCKVYNSG